MALGRQFDLYVEHDQYDDGLGYSTYSLAKRRGDDEKFTDQYGEVHTGRHSADVHGKVQVSHNPASPVSVHGWNEERYGEVLWQPRAFAEGDPQGSTGQQILFKEQYGSKEPGKSVVDGMFFTKDARAMAMPTLAAAAKDTAERYGRQLTPSGDRSIHSERLVQGLADQGIIEPHERTDFNTIDFGSSEGKPKDYIGDLADPSVLDTGKRTVRQMIRQAPGRKRRTDGEQLPLF